MTDTIDQLDTEPHPRRRTIRQQVETDADILRPAPPPVPIRCEKGPCNG